MFFEFSMLTLFCIFIVVSSLLGGVVPLLITPTHRRIQLAMSCIGGVMAGVAVLDLIPEALEYGETKSVMLWLLGGFLAIFLLERFLPSHCHDIAEDGHDQAHSCGHEHKLTWIGTYGGLSLHSVLAGIALAAAWSAGGVEVALGVFIAIVLHKPFDGLTLVSMMRVAKVDKTKSHLANVLFSFSVPLGVVLFQLVGEVSHPAIAAALAFSAGMFLCISLSDLLPELQFHGHDRLGLTFALIIGLAIAWGISSLHSHEGNDYVHDSHDESGILHEH
jgi:zinc and cadmium transporter|tara:strand:- start:1028 stop:1855 length:828 start_codon:yes stop_codon:yes gene_type:complete